MNLSPPLHDAKPEHSGHVHAHHASGGHTHDQTTNVAPSPSKSVLGWPAWQRVLAVLPVLMLMWLAVWWASAEVAPW